MTTEIRSLKLVKYGSKYFFIKPKVGQLTSRKYTFEFSINSKLANSLHENYFIEPNSSKIISSDPSWSTQYQKIFFIRPKLYNYHTQLDKNYFIRPKLANSIPKNIFHRTPYHTQLDKIISSDQSWPTHFMKIFSSNSS